MKSTVSSILVVVLVGCLAPATAFAQTNAGLDQYQLLSDIGWAIHSNSSIGQWFTVGGDGLLSGVEFGLYPVGGEAEDLVVEVYDFSGGTLGALRGFTSISVSDLGSLETVLDVNAITTTLISLEHLDIVVSSGETMAIWFTTTATSPNIYGIRGLTTDNYPNGERLTVSGGDPDNELMFKTFVAQPVFADDFESGYTSAWSVTAP